MFKFLPGILLLQLATMALMFALLKSNIGNYQIVAICLLWLVSSCLTGFWFYSIAQGLQQQSLNLARREHAKEREDLLVDSERQKAEIVKQSHVQIVKETNRAHAKANLKVGAMFTAAVGAGALMLLTQFITVGLLVIAGSGGALAGYITRAKQDRSAKKILQKQLHNNDQGLKRIESNSKK